MADSSTVRRYKQRFDLYRRGLVLDAGGVTEQLWLAEDIRHTWDDLGEVVYDASGAWVHSRQGKFRLDWRVRDWRELAERIAGRGAGPESAPAVRDASAVAPETIETWLGVEPGETLAVRRPAAELRALAWSAWLCLISGLLPLLGTIKGRPPISELLTLGLVGLAMSAVGLPLLIMAKQAAIAWADGQGIATGRGRWHRFVPWSRVDAVVREDMHNGYHILTDGRPILVPFTADNAEILVATAEKVVEARNRGDALPSEAAASDAALSRARLDGAVDEPAT